MYPAPRRPLFYKRPTSNVYRMFLIVTFILVALWLIRGLNSGQVTQPFQPTPTATRVFTSYVAEGDTHFYSGKLDAAILAYGEAARVDPTNAQIWAQLARIQTYSSALLTTDEERNLRLSQSRQSAERALELDPDDSTVRAIYAFTLDWSAGQAFREGLVDEERDFLFQAEQEAVRAIQLDATNTLALAFYAEILVDQQKWNQGEQYIRQASERGEELMDVHRVYAYVLESLALYRQAIEEYDRAIALAPNMTFLYARAGAIYRHLQDYDTALDYFDRAAKINEQLEIKDPQPYISISKTYSQKGEFFIAARNVQKAIEFYPSNADMFGQLGVIYFKSRNYEGSIPVLACAVRGCSAEESCLARYGRACSANFEEIGLDVKGLPLTPGSVVYYYTYGSVLASLSRPQQSYCAEAVKVLTEVSVAFADRPDILSIAADGLAICRSLGSSSLTPAPNPSPAP